MKFKILYLLLLTCCTTMAQDTNLKWLDLMLSNYNYPYKVAHLTLSTQQQKLQMGYMDVQPVNANSKTVMFLHGKNFNGAYFKTTIAALSSEGYRVIVPDQIGFGTSSKPSYYHYTFQQLAMNTKTL